MQLVKQWKVHLALLGVNAIYGATYSLAKLAMPVYISPSAFILVRVLSACFLFVVFHLLIYGKPQIHKSDLVKLAIAAFFGVALNMLLFFNGLSLTQPINASVLMLNAPLFVLLLNALIEKKRVNKQQIVGMLIAACGAVLLVGGTAFKFSTDHALGDLLITLNAVSYAFYLVYVKQLLIKYPSIRVIMWVFIFGSIYVFPFGIGGLMETIPSQWPGAVWGAIAFVTIGTTFMAYLINLWAVQKANAVTVGSYIYLQPVLAGLFGLALGQESLQLEKIIFALLIFSGVYLVNKK